MMRFLAPLVFCIPLAACDGQSSLDPASTEGGLEDEGVDCLAVYEDCRGQGGDEMSCKERYNACEGQPASGDYAACEEELTNCLETSGDGNELQCKEGFLACLGLEPPPPPGDDGEDHVCVDNYEYCIERGGDEVVCKERYATCLGGWEPPPPPPDEDGDGPDGDRPDGACPDHERPSPCQIGLDACASHAADEAELTACKAGFEACTAALSGELH